MSLDIKPTVIKEYELFHHVEMKGSQFVSMIHIERSDARFTFVEDITQALSSLIGTGTVERMDRVYNLDFLAKLQTRLHSAIQEEYNADAPPFLELFDLLKSRTKFLEDAYQDRLKRGVIDVDDLTRFFKPGDEVVALSGRFPIGGIFVKMKHHRGFMASYWEIVMKNIICSSSHPEELETSCYIDDWSGTRPISELSIMHKDKYEGIDALVERGKKFRVCTDGAKYMLYEGQIARRSWFGDTNFRADGRIMVDAKSFKTIDSDGYNQEERRLAVNKEGIHRHIGRGDQSSQDTSNKFVIEDKDLWRCSPYVFGFSFRAKQWGTLIVDQISEIQYREDAFDQLVLDPEYKRVIKALVQNSGGTFSDVVEGKGGGCIFLLEGEPGQGKTLTAETVAEVLKRPLYPISVGELGTDPDSLEGRLRTILDIATNWNAVLLLDEADIFLEARDTKDIVRNAMVGVFLRLLEYHEGVLFLTTNRADNIDRAFFSRISLALSFPMADEAKRRQVWINLLTKSGNKSLITDSLMERLVKRDINGRQIKNGIRLSQTLAKSENREMTGDDIEKTLDIGQAFIDKLNRRRNIYFRTYDWVRTNLLP